MGLSADNGYMGAAYNRLWTWGVPLGAWVVLAGAALGHVFTVISIVALGGSVLAAVHHADVISARIGASFGTLVLALAVTVIEVALILSLTIAGGSAAAGLARDTIFATVMLVLDGIVGLCLLIGGIRYREQAFDTRGVSAMLAVLAALTILTLVLPNYSGGPGPYYQSGQLMTVAIVALALYATFVLVQTVRHRSHFLVPETEAAEERPIAQAPSLRATLSSAALMLVSLGAVILLAHAIAPTVERIVQAAKAPKAVVGVVIAALVLLPEGIAAMRAASANRIQTSLNLAFGSAIASLSLTIPIVAFASLASGWPLALGLDDKSTVLLALSLLVATLALSTGRTNILQGAVLLVIFVVYLVTTLIP
jgi:Ca2+:H+ antiporter